MTDDRAQPHATTCTLGAATGRARQSNYLHIPSLAFVFQPAEWLHGGRLRPHGRTAQGDIELFFGLANYFSRLLNGFNAASKLEVLPIHQIKPQHMSPHPFNQACPHVSHKNQWTSCDVFHLKHLPDNEGFKLVSVSYGTADIAVVISPKSMR